MNITFKKQMGKRQLKRKWVDVEMDRFEIRYDGELIGVIAEEEGSRVQFFTNVGDDIRKKVEAAVSKKLERGSVESNVPPVPEKKKS